MGIQAGVIGQSQVLNPASTTGGGKMGKANTPSGWAWFWFVASLLFLVFSHLAARGRQS